MNKKTPENWLIPDWPVPANIQAVTTTRQGGVSLSPYDAMNVGDHVEDKPEHVEINRKRLEEYLDLPASPLWLTQVHGVVVSCADEISPVIAADASVSHQSGNVCAVMTADCLPVLFCSKDGQHIGAAHAGWRGLHAGVLEATVDKMKVAAEDILAWMGPAIGPEAFEVGEVREAFMSVSSDAEKAFKPTQDGKWLADIYRLAKQRLQAKGVKSIYGGGECTFSDAERFYSYRRAPKTGRMVSLIWRNL